MKNNNINLNINTINLLYNRDFLSALKFESEYGAIVKGGHLPYFYSKEKKNRLVNSVNLLLPEEQKEIVSNQFISEN
jgi:hypothetical protein